MRQSIVQCIHVLSVLALICPFLVPAFSGLRRVYRRNKQVGRVIYQNRVRSGDELV